MSKSMIKIRWENCFLCDVLLLLGFLSNVLCDPKKKNSKWLDIEGINIYGNGRVIASTTFFPFAIQNVTNL